MKKNIDIITGFLESGKTTFIQELLQSDFLQEFQKILILVCEEGFTAYDKDKLKGKEIQTVFWENIEKLDDTLISKLDEKYQPDYILIEYNGTWKISDVLGMNIPFEYRFRNVVFLSDAEKFSNQLNNMAFLMQPHILNSDMVVFNRFEKMQSSERHQLIKEIKMINGTTKVIMASELEKEKSLKERFLTSDNPENKSFNLKMNLELGFWLSIVIAVLVAIQVPSIETYMGSVVTIFLSIIIQAIPFILLGAFISAMIQIFVPTGWIIRQIEKKSWYSFLLASVAGFFLPICDCGMAPIVSGLLRKNAPLPQTMTFWLSSSAVSPIVIISMLYAFPGQLNLVVLRILTGVAIGIVAGIVLNVAKIETKDVIKENGRVRNIGKDILDLRYQGVSGKIEAVVAGAQIEFFRVVEYVIIGAMLSAVVQTVMPKAIKGFVGNNIFIQFVIMIIAAIFISICSTSNVFIGRSFSNNISVIPILSYVVMGPMLDLGNMAMLSAVLKKKFLAILMVLVMIEGSLLFGVLAFLFR